MMRAVYRLAGLKRSFDPEGAIVYEDNHILVVKKPPGLLSQGDQSKDPDLLSVYKPYLKERDHKPGDVWLAPIHRLDRMVGGLTILAKTSKAASRLNAKMRAHEILKRYIAIVRGAVEPSTGRLVHALSREPRGGRYRVVSPGEGRQASLSYRRLAYERGSDLSLVLISLETGRPHQIRLQFSAIGHPLYLDQRYGPAVPRAGERSLGPALFACQLGFKHPTRELCMNLYALPDKDSPFQIFCDELGDLL